MGSCFKKHYEDGIESWQQLHNQAEKECSDPMKLVSLAPHTIWSTRLYGMFWSQTREYTERAKKPP